mmetsp:Transcript_75464/g.151703  ORF Transcript_75464/g.151703 Transcript_75464/m.151703 type:complete len:104 (-) Transcript_75464:9-320(-)
MTTGWWTEAGFSTTTSCRTTKDTRGKVILALEMPLGLKLLLTMRRQEEELKLKGALTHSYHNNSSIQTKTSLIDSSWPPLNISAALLLANAINSYLEINCQFL